ncbi:MAG TPA: OmpA family protein [Kofleriaceae bacterium]|jgi:chemotaxis protein MotB|nr:OmpA family protein [Kofleriaceae bacterium]
MAQRPPDPPTSSGKKQRGFPWRLWLYAIVMTAGAVAGGYFTWQYRSTGKKAAGDLHTCAQNLKSSQDSTAKHDKEIKTCTDALGAATLKATELEKQNTEGTKNLTASQAELVALRAQKAEADKRMAAIEDIRKQFAKMIDTGQLKVSARRGQLVISLPSEVLFTTGSADLSKQGEYAVVEVAAVLKKLPDRRFLIVGHTDNVEYVKPKGGDTGSAAAGCPVCPIPTDNWTLSTARALTVTRVLVTAGMDAKSVVPSGVGANDPVADNGSADGRKKNRRIEIALLPSISELPPLPANLSDETAPAPDAPKK